MAGSNDVTLSVDGKVWHGWKKVEISTSLETVSGAFALGVTERWPGSQDIHQIQPGMACSVAIGGETLITGWIDDVEPSYDKGSHELAIKGRDRTGDLVDCSAMPGSFEFGSTDLMSVSRVLCRPFGIGVSATVNVTASRHYLWHIQVGETVFEAIERLARGYAVLATSDGLGNLVFTRAGQGGAHAELRLGGTILKAKGVYSFKDRFSHYIVMGQFLGSDTMSPEASAFGRSEATDPAVKRYRPKIIMPEGLAAAPMLMGNRAEWECRVHAGRSRKATITVQGWRDADGELYRFNRMVKVEDDFLGIHDSLLIAGVKFTLDESGTLTELSLTRREAFELRPVREGVFDAGGA